MNSTKTEKSAEKVANLLAEIISGDEQHSKYEISAEISENTANILRLSKRKWDHIDKFPHEHRKKLRTFSNVLRKNYDNEDLKEVKEYCADMIKKENNCIQFAFKRQSDQIDKLREEDIIISKDTEKFLNSIQTFEKGGLIEERAKALLTIEAVNLQLDIGQNANVETKMMHLIDAALSATVRSDREETAVKAVEKEEGRVRVFIPIRRKMIVKRREIAATNDSKTAESNPGATNGDMSSFVDSSSYSLSHYLVDLLKSYYILQSFLLMCFSLFYPTVCVTHFVLDVLLLLFNHIVYYSALFKDIYITLISWIYGSFVLNCITTIIITLTFYSLIYTSPSFMEACYNHNLHVGYYQ
mmetsp:Transcript_1058/g.1179  ORF Transcript_1058/g.1179 Transcript_1058/m.1179 type:complete len:356 (+) Transcript_1058:171-1238(+)